MTIIFDFLIIFKQKNISLKPYHENIPTTI